MSDAGIPLRVIQQVSGHRNLQHVQNYIEVREEQVLGAVSALSILSPVTENVGKWIYDDVTPTALPERSDQIYQQENG
jgi:integrase/recombinase XerD